ncbi:MAG: M15 family metallopeptidase [Gemmatimonadetes bacterium]|nr:M15 family metallopeptidase [Gemmatimonadota bacterium]
MCSPPDAQRLGAQVHQDVVEPFLLLRADALAAGLDLRILSGFRSFERQNSIWNRKATGELAVLDSRAAPLDIEQLTKRELVYAILRWSALPGASRHHWGTDIDVYDENARPSGYEIELTPEEVDAGGMFAPLHEWLDQRLAAGAGHGFFRPYDQDRQGVAPERWHLSHTPVAATCEEGLTIDILRASLSSSDLKLKGTVLDHLEDIYRRFVINTNRNLS